MAETEIPRQRRVALALLVRRHLLECQKEIKTAYDAKFPAEAKDGDTNQVSSKSVGDRDVEKSARNGSKASTLLAKLIGLPAYDIDGRKPEPAKYLLDFLQNPGPQYSREILSYFRDHVFTPEYRSRAPTYIQVAIHEVLDRSPHNEASPSSNAAENLPDDLQRVISQARYAPHAVLAAIEETVPQLTAPVHRFEGTWNIIRYSHNGKRIVRGAMQVTRSASGRPTFKLYYRNHGLTVNNPNDRFVSRGSLIVLKGGQHVMFIGHEEAIHQDLRADGYPITLICSTNITKDGPFKGLALRRHVDGPVFATKAQFVRAHGVTIDDLFAANKIGSFTSAEDIARMEADIPGLEDLLSDLERSPDDLKGGLVL